MSKTVLTREELYELVWSTPMSQLAIRFGISDVALKKTCTRLSIPTPGRGYWAKLQHGCSVRRTPLPKPRPGAPTTYQVHRAPRSPQPVVDEAPTRERLQITREIAVPNQLRAPHALVARTRDGLKEAHRNQNGKVHAWQSGCLDVSVYPESVSRALRILNTLVREAERLGFHVMTGGERGNDSFLEIRGQRLQFALIEKSRREVRPASGRRYSWDEYDYFPTGLLRLELKDVHVDGRKVWSDTKMQKVEDVIGSFLSGAFDAALATIERDRKRAERAMREAEERARQLETERRRREEEARRLELEHQAERWEKSRLLRRYIEEIERRAMSAGLSADERHECDEWLLWAREHAERLDPLVAGLPHRRRLASDEALSG